MAFVVAATWKAKAGQEDRIRRVIETMTEASRQEPANLYFQGQVSPDDPGLFFLYEQYEDADGYEAHKATPHFQRHVIEDASPNLEDRNVQTFKTIDV